VSRARFILKHSHNTGFSNTQMLIAADIEGVLMGFELDAMIRNPSASSVSTTHVATPL
jgi:hypothetical protein